MLSIIRLSMNVIKGDDNNNYREEDYDYNDYCEQMKFNIHDIINLY